MIPYSNKKVNQFKIRNQMQHSHSKRGTQYMFSPIGLPLFSNRLSIRLTQDQKGRSKACNGDECKGFIKVLPKKCKAQRVKKKVSHAHGLSTKEVYVKLAHTIQKLPKIISREHLTKSIRLTGKILGLFIKGSK
ncbi:hypothetical protein H5410_003565 [Solanum commersonii]|uniref:Uncharacterized protein n=1 Tax=Solanum commersonii TaxID=4109 RepID=A0A9J6B5D6_SOLCO|nr:hypothetical protein H5410_003565 [Solanum commersonii]